ncbi:MAG: class I SAM-dependent methyltransferase [Oceanospirillaceae bacterium]|nr:class I SAM-dependent methyltransferase [Colwellia sp.]NQZ30102.1 class I SAM-dependent methyltransferase [Oceanospirillaceae bacterium]
MDNQTLKNVFNQNTADNYDRQRDKLAPIKEALHLCMHVLLSDLPATARVLCVGAGTGSELIYLAQAFPQWHFTIVEPSKSMIDVCTQRTKELGIHSRCTFHQGYLESLSESAAFDVATSILVSHFITDVVERGEFFTQISSKLKMGAYMINADLASDMSSKEYKNLLQVWLNLHDYAGMTIRVKSFGSKIALLPHQDVASIIKASGFDNPVLFFQTVFIHAWFSKVNANKQHD